MLKSMFNVRSVLFTIALLFFASTTIRIVEASDGIKKSLTNKMAEPLEEVHETTHPVSLFNCGPDADMDVVIQALKERETNIINQENALASRLTALHVTETLIKQQLEQLDIAQKRLERAETRFSKRISQTDTAAENDVKKLTSVYENMKPKDAARLFEEMEPEFAAGFLAEMSPNAAAAIMAGLPSETAYTISVVLAGRNSQFNTTN
ncbi:MAG: MotE family protein [Halocynthiibacter sp.]